MKNIPRYFSTGSTYFVDKRKNDADPYMEGSSVKRSKENDLDKSNENNFDSNIQKINTMVDVFNSQNNAITNLLDEALDNESEIEAASPDTNYVSDSDSDLGGKTELYKFMSKRKDERVEMAEEHLKSKEKVSNDESARLDLSHMLSSTKHDLNTVKVLADQLAEGERDQAWEAVQSLEKTQQEQLSLYSDIYGVDAPNIADYGTKPSKIMDDDNVSDTKSSSPAGSDSLEANNNDHPKSSLDEKTSEKGSLIDDFADVSSEPADYMGGDD